MTGKKLEITAIFIVTIMILISFTVTVPASAESLYASIDTAKVSVKIPDGFNITSADTHLDDNVTYNLDAYMEDTSKKLNICSERNPITTDIYNFKYLSEEELTKEVENIKAGKKTLVGTTFQSVSAASLKEMPEYILFTVYDSQIQNNITVNYAIAYTVLNGELVTIQYSSASGTFNSEDSQNFSEICESFYVTALFDKPSKFSMAKVLKTVLWVILVIGIIIGIVLLQYYFGSRKSTKNSDISRNRRKISEDYYKSLRKEGIIEDIKMEAEEFITENIANTGNTVIEPSENARPKNPEKISAIIEEASNNPTLIQDDEWEDVDLKKMFQKPVQIPHNRNRNTNVPPFPQNMPVFLDESQTNRPVAPPRVVVPPSVERPEMNTHRSDSAKRYAKLFIGDNKTSAEEYPVRQRNSEEEQKLSDIERRHRERQNRNKKSAKKKSLFSLFDSKSTKKKTTNKKRTSERTARKPRNTQGHQKNDIFAQYELDNYWDTYNND